MILSHLDYCHNPPRDLSGFTLVLLHLFQHKNQEEWRKPNQYTPQQFLLHLEWDLKSLILSCKLLQDLDPSDFKYYFTQHHALCSTHTGLLAPCYSSTVLNPHTSVFAADISAIFLPQIARVYALTSFSFYTIQCSVTMLHKKYHSVFWLAPYWFVPYSLLLYIIAHVLLVYLLFSSTRTQVPWD